MRLAYVVVRIQSLWSDMNIETHVFDVRARVNGDNVAVLDAKVVTDDTVDASLTIFEIVIGENNQDSVLALLSLDQNGVATEELERLHGVIGKSDNRVVIVGGIGDAVIC